MNKRRNPTCPHCKNPWTVKRGSRNGCKRYSCQACHKCFTVDHHNKAIPLWIPHLDGISFRSLANVTGLSPAQIYRTVKKEMNALPENTWLTQKYCNRFCGILIVDGKYVKVKGFKQKIPFIYGIDYLTHDIPVGILANSENEEAFLKFFRLLKTCNYPLRVIVGDDRFPLGVAAEYHYQKVKSQLCQNHYVENIRQRLNVRTNPAYQHFFQFIYTYIFQGYKNTRQLYDNLHYLLKKQAKHDPLRQEIIVDIYKRRKELFQYASIEHCPKDTNLIELYNSHLQSRLKSIKGFKSFQAAERWLNAYLVRRRTKPLTDCDQKFKYLNGKCSLERTLKRGGEWPEMPGIMKTKR